MNPEPDASPDQPPPRRSLWPLLLAAAVATAAGFGLGRLLLAPPAPPALEAGTLVAPPRPLAPFALTDQDGEPLRNDDLRGRWHLLFFGYTHCPDVCPTTLGLLDRVLRRVRRELPQAPLEVLFVSVDPARDDPAQLGRYVRYFNPEFRGATGDDGEIGALTRSLGVVYLRMPAAEGGEYLVDHSAAILLIDPQVRLAGVFSAPQREEDMSRDLVAILRSHGD